MKALYAGNPSLYLELRLLKHEHLSNKTGGAAARALRAALKARPEDHIADWMLSSAYAAAGESCVLQGLELDAPSGIIDGMTVRDLIERHVALDEMLGDPERGLKRQVDIAEAHRISGRHDAALEECGKIRKKAREGDCLPFVLIALLRLEAQIYLEWGTADQRFTRVATDKLREALQLAKELNCRTQMHDIAALLSEIENKNQ